MVNTSTVRGCSSDGINNSCDVENVVLAGDWTNTSLPATIESAIKSGKNAAKYAINGANTF